MRFRLLFVCALLVLQGCASRNLDKARDQFFDGNTQSALSTLDTSSVARKDILLAYLDRGLIAHTAGDYQQSIRAFIQATAILDAMDYVSLREQSATLVTNDWVKVYKGEYSERLWIHTYQMMNFLLLDQPEGAAVEARKALQVYAAHGKELKDDVYTRMLIAQSFEAAGKLDSAHIEYRKLIDDLKHDDGIPRRAWQNAKRIGRADDANQFKRFITTSSSAQPKGELVLFLQAGAIPEKHAGEIHLNRDLYASFPVYRDYRAPALSLAVENNGMDQQADVVDVALVDISRTALLSRGKTIGLKSFLRASAKQGITEAILDESIILGVIAGIALQATELADTRSWETLPAQLALVHVPLDEGQHTINFTVSDGFTVHELTLSDIKIQPGKKTYRTVRVGAGAPNT